MGNKENFTLSRHLVVWGACTCNFTGPKCICKMKELLLIFEGFRGKRAYIAFLADFHFLQDRANFWQTDLF